MTDWIDICDADDLQPDSGICARVEGRQVAIFYLPKEKTLFAVGNYDPIGRANVLSRGMIGDLGGQPVVASPLYKQHFNLETGVCVEDAAVSVPVYPVRIENGRVEVGVGG